MFDTSGASINWRCSADRVFTSSQTNNAPWLAIFAGVVITLTVASINFVGDGLREAIDPRLKER